MKKVGELLRFVYNRRGIPLHHNHHLPTGLLYHGFDRPRTLTSATPPLRDYCLTECDLEQAGDLMLFQQRCSAGRTFTCLRPQLLQSGFGVGQTLLHAFPLLGLSRAVGY